MSGAGDKIKNIFKGKDSDADKSNAFTGEPSSGGGIDKTNPASQSGAPGLGSAANSGENTSAFTGKAEPKLEDTVTNPAKKEGAPGLGNAAQSGVSFFLEPCIWEKCLTTNIQENTSAFTGGEVDR